MWEVLVDKYNDQQKPNAAVAQPPPTPDDTTKANKDTAGHIADMLLSLPKANRMMALMKLPISDRRTLLQYVPGEMRDKLLADFSPAERETWFAMNGPTGEVVSELQQAKILPAIYSERQFEEAMTGFCFNQFSVSIYI